MSLHQLTEPRMDAGGISPRVNGSMRPDGEGAPELVVASSRPTPRAPRMGLTPRMRDGLNFIADTIAKTGNAPTMREICAGIGLAPNSVARAAEIVQALEDRGAIARIRKNDGKAARRSLVIVSHKCPHCGGDLSAAPLNPASNVEASS